MARKLIVLALAVGVGLMTNCETVVTVSTSPDG